MVEDAYLNGLRIDRYTRPQVDRHMAHVADRQTLRQVSELASASAVAARLRQLELAATAILDLAIAQADGKLAIQALREARATIATMSQLAGGLAASQSEDSERPDLDAAIAKRLGATEPSVTGKAAANEPMPDHVPAPPALPSPPRALPAGQ